MGLFDNFKKVDVRSLENPNIPVSAENFLHLMGWGDFNSSSGVVVNVENALGVPAGTPNAFSTFTTTPELELKSPHPIRCRKFSADTGILGFSSDLTSTFLKLSKRPMLWFP